MPEFFGQSDATDGALQEHFYRRIPAASASASAMQDDRNSPRNLTQSLLEAIFVYGLVRSVKKSAQIQERSDLSIRPRVVYGRRHRPARRSRTRDAILAEAVPPRRAGSKGARDIGSIVEHVCL